MNIQKSEKQQFPKWIRRQWPAGEDFAFTKDLVLDLDLHTVCQSANCPNLGECWSRRTATFMILGNVCTRSCRYCSVHAGAPEAVDPREPLNVAEAVRRMKLKHTVITSVTRDDLLDGGAGYFAAVIQEIKRANPETTVEVLVPDFEGRGNDIERVLDAGPEVFSHNIETVERIYPIIRSRRYDYHLGLRVLRTAAEYSEAAIIKSALMVGHGETADEVRATLCDLLEVGCSAVSIGQYLRPTKKQRAVEAFIRPEQFEVYEALAYELGFEFAVAGPFVRSSYRSDEMMKQHFARRRVASARGA
jgi:lipoyl synthase